MPKHFNRKQGGKMKKDKIAKTDQHHASPEEPDILERLLKKYANDEMGLLDLVFIDQILSQQADEKVTPQDN